MTLDAAAERIKIETHRFVRHQATAFRKLGGLHWFDLTQQGEVAIVEFVANWLDAGLVNGYHLYRRGLNSPMVVVLRVSPRHVARNT